MARILIAEDDASMRQFLAMALEKAGHAVTLCENGMTALQTIESDPAYDLLLSDIVMPGIDGIELSRKAVAVVPTLKVMFITGFAAVAAENGAENDAKILSKPFHLKDLVDQVGQLLAA
ncbi:response regulator [Micavibrio aeruginosavorus]|uniref:response regulator n=1 Tax=Micavibrio aeruginosavorus TaxID=349221 RepID=UPI003F4A909A